MKPVRNVMKKSEDETKISNCRQPAQTEDQSEIVSIVHTFEKASMISEAIPSHRLMLRAGLIRKLTSGVYDFLPAGYRVLRRVEAIVREEMDRAGCQEILMPLLILLQ